MTKIPIDQKAEVRFAPPRALIPWITAVQVWVYEKSGGRIGARAAGMPHLILRGIRRRARKPFAVCLPYWLDETGRRFVIASFGGAPKNPAWYHNAKDHEANPTVTIRDGARVFTARVAIVGGEQRARLWEKLVADRPFYGRYQAGTAREIPVVELIEVQPS